MPESPFFYRQIVVGSFFESGKNELDWWEIVDRARLVLTPEELSRGLPQALEDLVASGELSLVRERGGRYRFDL